MDFMQSLRILRRRWILTTLLLLLTLAGTAGAFKKLPHTYISTSTVVLLASKNASKANGGNPYLSFSSSLPLTADVLRRELLDPRTALDLAGRGYTAGYLVTDAPDTTGPVLLVTVTGHDKAAVEHTLYGVTAEIGTKLLALQASITPTNQIRVATLSVTPEAKLSISKLARPLVVLLGFGLLLTFAVPLIVDAQISRRRPRDLAGPPPEDLGRPDRDGYERRPGPPRERMHPPEHPQPGRAPGGQPGRAPGSQPGRDLPQPGRAPGSQPGRDLPPVRAPGSQPGRDLPQPGRAPGRQPGRDLPPGRAPGSQPGRDLPPGRAPGSQPHRSAQDAE
jgi:hypothetical protein